MLKVEDFVFNNIGNFLLKFYFYLLLICKIKTISIMFIITLKEILSLQSTETNKSLCQVRDFYETIHYYIKHLSVIP